jgi:Holliday junction DNA helicase RuvB
MGAQIRTTSGPAIERAGDLAAVLTSLGKGDVLFIDEIHRLSHAVEEILYPAMEDFALDVVLGKGPGARTVRLQIEHVTVIGATTRVGSITGPLRDRFGATYRLDYYTGAELERILRRSAEILGVSLTDEAAALVARRSRGTPRIANRLLKRVRDYAQVRGETDGAVTEASAADALSLLEIDERGLDAMDRQLLRAIAEHHAGGPVGLATMAATVSEPIETIEDVVEPYLMQIGFLARTSRGRQLTSGGWEHLNLTPPPGSAAASVQPGLFDA